MRKLTAVVTTALGLIGTPFVHASPVVIEPVATISAPGDQDFPAQVFARHVAVDGDNALLLGEIGSHRAVAWFQKSGGTWLFKRVLADVIAPENVAPALALRENIAGFIGEKLRVFEFNGNDFVAAPVIGTVNGPNLVIDGGRILGSDTSTCEWDGSLFTKVSGTWTVTQHFEGPFFGCSDNMPGSGLALRGGYLALMWPHAPGQSAPLAGVYKGGPPQIIGPINNENLVWGPDIATSGQSALVASDKKNGVERFSAGAEEDVYDGSYRPLDAYVSNITRTVKAGANNYVFQNTWSYDRAGWVINVFRGAEHVATLVAPNGASLGTRFDVSGSRVLVSGISGTTGVNAAYVFELPASFPVTPATVQDSFQTSNAAGWTALPGSQFSIVTDGRTKVWRQANTTGYAGAVFNGTDGTVQGVQAEVIRRATDGTDRWLAVMTRYSDGGNYYYASLRDSNKVELRKIVNGKFALIASAPFTVSANHQYRLQLVSNRNLHQVYVDGKKVLQGFDTSHAHGQAGVRTYKTAADFDNVLVTGRGHTTIYRTDFTNEWLDEYPVNGDLTGDWQLGTHRAGQLSQRALNVFAETNTSLPTRDQVVQARITPDAFGTPPTGEQAWFGLRIGSYYLAVTSSNQMRLLKKFSWGYQIMGTITFTLPTTQREYRLEMIGNVIRAYADGRAMLEAVDTQQTAEPVTRGMATNYAQASFDDFLAYQP